MNVIVKPPRCLVLIVALLISGFVCGQSVETYYPNKQLRSVEVKKKGKNVLTVFKSEQGENLLIKGDFVYTYFDNAMNMTRIVEVKNKRIDLEFWLTKTDTLYYIAKYDSTFINQSKDFANYLKKQLKYSRKALDHYIEGKVFVGFVVNKKGEISTILPLTTIGYGLESSVVELISTYKNWGVITIKNKPVNCYLKLPVTFSGAY